MDQVRNFLRVIRRIHFWLICGLITMLSLAVWFLAVGELKKAKEARATQIEGLFNEATRIVSEPNIPNATIADKMDELIAQRQEEILEAWQVKYEQQNSEETGILTWPKELGASFLRKVSPLRPIEKMVEFPPSKNDNMLNVGEREDYRDYIRSELPKLADSIGAKWNAGETARSGGRENYRPPTPGSGETLASQSVVSWSDDNQQELVASHFTWGGESTGRGGPESFATRGYSPGGSDDKPSTLEVLYAQEDLWVLRSLMKIIQETNAGATSRFNAAVKKIDFIRIGKNADAKAGKVTVAKTAEEMAAGSMTGMGPDGPREQQGERYREGGGAEQYDMMEGGPDGGRAVNIPDPADLRYVDRNYQPLPGTELRRVMTATEALAPEEAYLAVAKRVPIRMRVSIDQRKLPHLLVECANAELTVEVRQLRVNPEDDGSLRGGPMPGYPGPRGPRNPELSTMRDPSGMGPVEANPFPFDVTVEIYGIVYLYNPVDRRAMGMEESSNGGDEAIDPNNVTQWADPTTLGLAQVK